MSEYESGRIAVDSVIIAFYDDKLKVFLKNREKEPYLNQLELIGGLILNNETAEETLKRKLIAFPEFKKTYFKQFHTFTNPNRDPRIRTISISFISLVKIEESTDFYDIGSSSNLAFDHREIINLALEYLKENLSPLLIKHLLPNKFPLNKLQRIYELIEGIKYDNRNFRKKMINSKIVEETNELEINVSHRPAKLFQIK